MIDIKKIIEISDLQKQRGLQTVKHRFIFPSLCKSKGKHMVGLVGPRGVGKTVLLKQLATNMEDSVYVSADSFPNLDLFDVVEKLIRNYGFKNIFIDEVHVAKDYSIALKAIYDLLPVGKIFFSSSIAILLNSLPSDLSRRVVLYSIMPFSFREYLYFKFDRHISSLTPKDFFENNLSAEIYQTAAFFPEYLAGGLMPYALDEPEPLTILKNILEAVLEKDLLKTQKVTMEDIDIMRRMVSFISKNPGVDGISYSSLSQNLVITKYKAQQYVDLLEKAFVLMQVKPYGTSVTKEPKILLMPPYRLLERNYPDALGGLREDYFVMACKSLDSAAFGSLSYLKSLRGSKTPDFIINNHAKKIIFEVGGSNKNFTQFKDFKAKAKRIVLAQDLELSKKSQDVVLPLHALGFL